MKENLKKISELMNKFKIKVASVDAPVATLSGVINSVWSWPNGWQPILGFSYWMAQP